MSDPKSTPESGEDRAEGGAANSAANSAAEPTERQQTPAPRRELTGEGPGPIDRKQPAPVTFRSRTKELTKPRRVRGGLKLKAKEGEQLGNWIGQRLFRVIEEGVSGDAVREGLGYGRLGQIRRIEFEHHKTEDNAGSARVVGAVQGRRQRAYTTTIALPAFAHEQQETIVSAMSEQSRYAAKLLSGELPPSIEDLFAPLGLRLFPVAADEITTDCDCTEPKPWCKHAVCLAAMLAERMSDDPFLIFALRGMESEVLIDALRQKRAVAGLGTGPSPVHLAHVPGASDIGGEPLDTLLDRFWEPASDNARLETP
ncbi:MAG: hypothetical protein AAF235_06120, partial [Planctomycetota bacterium]